MAVFAAAMAAHAFGGSTPATEPLWTELPVSGHIQKAQALPDFVDLAAKLSPAVVNISTEESEQSSGEVSGREEHHGEFPSPYEEFGRQRQKSLGSGFIITKDGYILTNDHVIENPGKITVTTQDGHDYQAKLVGRDAKSDIALVKIDAKRELATAPLGNSDEVRVGEWVMAIGNPFGFDHSVTVGVVSTKGRFIPGNFDQFIQTDASINPGNSGGPLIDARGQVVAVNSAIYTTRGSNMGIGFAIPVNLVKEELAQLRDRGTVVRGWLGVSIQSVTPELAESLGLKEVQGALVAEVRKNGPAEEAGVKRGDVIVAFNNQAITDSRELPLLVARIPLGRQVALKIIREKHEMEMPVTITESHEEELAAADGPHRPHPGGSSGFGLHVKDLSSELARELGLDIQSGVLVASVQLGSRGDEAGLRARDVILEVNHATVKDVDSYEQALKAGSPGQNLLLLIKRGDTTAYVVLKPEG